MNTYYYIPVNSLNFNNILSSESISPLSFYEKRGYGFKRFERISANPFPYSILAYNKVTTLDAPKSDRDEFAIYVAIPKSYFINNNKEISVGDLTILQTDATIYLNWKECFFIVPSEIDKRKLIGATKRSLEIKHSDLYLKNVFAIDDYRFDIVSWDEKLIESIRDYKNVNQEQILVDQKINKIKGFIYGYVAGKLKEQPDEIAVGKRYFQDFINSYSVLMNELSVLANERKSYKKIDTKRTASEFNHLKDVKERISFLFGENEQIELDNFFKTSFGINSDQIELFKTLNYKKTNNSIYSIVSRFLKDKNKELYGIDDLLSVLIANGERFISNPSSNSYKSLEETFNTYRMLISSKISDYQKDASLSVTFEGIPFTVEKDFSVKKIEFTELSNDENNNYNSIINDLLSRLELSTTDEIAQQRLDIIQNIAQELKRNKTASPDDMEYLRRLYKSLKTVGVGFKIEESSNLALQTLSCFLSRYSEMDKLQDYMEKNKYKNYGLAYGLWGAAYGYANISKILLEPLEAKEDVLNIIDNYISDFVLNKTIDEKRIASFLDTIQINEPKSPTIEWKIKDENLAEESKNSYKKEESFIDVINSNSKLNKNPEWIRTLEKCYSVIINEYNIGNSLFDNDYMVVEFKRALVNEKEKKRGSLSGFGEAKIEEAMSELKKYLSSIV